MEERKLIATQDDCGKNSYPYFNTEMSVHTGMDMIEFKSVSEVTRTENGYEWVHEGNVLCWESDNTGYKLFKA